MKLTAENKAHIDSLSYQELSRRWRFARIGDSWFIGETATYWTKRMNDIRKESGGESPHVSASKSIVWNN